MFSGTFSVTFKLTCICLNQEQQQWFPVSIQTGAWKCCNNVGYANVITTVNWSQSSGYNILWRYIPSVNYAQLSSSIKHPNKFCKIPNSHFQLTHKQVQTALFGCQLKMEIRHFYLSNTANVLIQQKCNICFIFLFLLLQTYVFS